MIRSLISGIQDLVYPPICAQCHRHITLSGPFAGLCPNCIGKITLNTPPFCIKCTRHLTGPFPGPLCNICSTYKLHYDFAFSACPYQNPLRELIHQFKFHQKTYLRYIFVQLILTFIERQNLDLQQFDLFLPVPLSATRLRERGYNQSHLLTQMLCRHYQKPSKEGLLVKKCHTQSQSFLPQKERFTNVKGAFRIKPSSRIINNNILIIDDLLTTGATASACALALKNAGAQRVAVLTLAIA